MLSRDAVGINGEIANHKAVHTATTTRRRSPTIRKQHIKTGIVALGMTCYRRHSRSHPGSCTERTQGGVGNPPPPLARESARPPTSSLRRSEGFKSSTLVSILAPIQAWRFHVVGHCTVTHLPRNGTKVTACILRPDGSAH